MKPFRLLLLVAGALAALLVIAVAVAFSTSFQTWLARKTLAAQPGVRATLGAVSAGMKHVELKELRFEKHGAVLTLPLVEVDMPVFSAGWRKKVLVSRLVAKGWTLDLTKLAVTPGASAANVGPQAPAPSSVSPAGTAATQSQSPASTPAASSGDVAAQAFAGIFSNLELPVDVALDGVQLEGEVILPESRGRAKVTLSGGGLAAGREGAFELLANMAVNDPKVTAVNVRATFGATMDTPRSFTGLKAKFDAAASGAQFPKPVKLHADVAATRVPTGESYALAIIAEEQEIVALKATFPRDAKKLDGTWKIDVRDADIAPFAMGKTLPAFTAVGGGSFDTDATFATVHVLGRLNATLDRLEAVRPELANVGELKIVAEFDLAERSGTFVVQKFTTAFAASQPIATVRTLQPFEFTPGTTELRAADASHALLGLALENLPVAWLKPFLKTAEIKGGHLRGELTAAARGGGVTLRSTSPLTIDGVSVYQEGKPILQGVDVALGTSADYTPQGWQAEITGLTLKSGEMPLVTLDAKAGQLAGDGQAIKATGKLSAQLPALLAQPGAAGNIALTQGEATADFVVSVNEKHEVQATLALKNLATTADGKTIALPTLSGTLRADVSADGKIAFNAPIAIERDGRKSDLTIIGTMGPEKDKARLIDAEVTSTHFVVGDAQILTAAQAVKPAAGVDAATTATATATSTRDAAPPWAGWHGSLALQLKHVVYSESLEASNISGRLRLDAGMLKLEGLQAGLGETGRANLNGTVTFDETAPQPYTLAADFGVKEFDPAPLFRALNGNQPATLEGKFDVTSKLASRAATLADLTAGAGGTFQVTSKGGVFRGLPVSVSNITETTNRFYAWLASAGTAITSIAGKKETIDVANKPEAITEVARALNPIAYDQVSVTVIRDAALNTTFKNFTLIAPEVRLTGSGTALHRPGATLLEDSLAMEFALRVRGRQGELLKYLNALEPQTDDLGYATCTVPLKVGGSLAKPDTTEVNGKLAALAIEKSGFGDKATEFINKIRGVKQ